MPRAAHLFRLAGAIALLITALPMSRSAEEGANDAVKPPGAIAVRVVNEAGAPQPDADLSLFRFDRDWRTWQPQNRDIRTDAAGAARYEELPIDSYTIRAQSSDGLVGLRTSFLLDDQQQQDVGVKIERPTETSITVQDESGKPVAGARIWQLECTGANGSVDLDPQSLETLGLQIEPSNADGVLALPPLPPGTLKVRLIHADYAPCEVKGVRVGETAAKATMQPGVKLALRFEMEDGASPVDSVMIDFRHSPYDHPSTLIGRLPHVQADGSAEICVAAGDYGTFQVNHPEYIATPMYSELRGSMLSDATEPIQVRPGENTLTFRLQRKVKLRGRAIDAETGKPIVGESIEAQAFTGPVSGPFARFAEKWSHIGWAETGKNGEYEIDMPAGQGRVLFQGQGLVATPEHHELTVAADGSTKAPDFLIRKMPVVRGIVLDANGEPAANAVVRFRGSMLTYGVSPVITDEQGRFELAPPWIPVDLKTHEQLPAQTLVAFAPDRWEDGDAVIHLDQPDTLKEVVLQMSTSNSGDFITRITSDLNPWQRGVVAPEERTQAAAISLKDKPAPELDGAHWINAGRPKTSLADFRGKYVLLQFWTTWCGPCHTDMPALKLLSELYKDKGLVVIGVHDNSTPLEAIEKDVIKNKLLYPIVVDHPDGRIMSVYNAHGISGFPSYVLIDPQGRVIKEDRTIASPTLRSFKFEIIRQLLLTAPVANP
jgi:thiol-disulfide isomerase/thioredoxin